MNRFSLFFEYEDKPGFGYEFPCSADGVVEPYKLCKQSRNTYFQCKSGMIDGHKVVERRVVEYGEESKTGLCIEMCGCARRVTLAKLRKFPDPDIRGTPIVESKRTRYEPPRDWWEEL